MVGPMTTGRKGSTWAVGLGMALLAALAAACGSPTPTPTSSSASTPPALLPAATPPAPIVWSTCTGNPSFQCGSVSVPIDYQHPGRATLEVAVTRAAALQPAQRVGTLVFNPGGPGESGNQILPVVFGSLPAAVRQRFDVVSFDPRGTGASDPLECGTSPSVVTSLPPVPSSASQPLPGTRVFTAMAQACQTRFPQLTPFINTINTARDMDRIRAALGDPTISFYGLSYGTVLGTVYAQLFPQRVRSMVLDGAVDINATLTQQAIQQAPAAEQSLHHLLDTCGGVTPCPLGPDPVGYFQTVGRGLPSGTTTGANPAVTVGDLDTATLLALSVPAFTSSYFQAVVAAHNGNPAPLRALALDFVTDIDGASLVDSLWAITCNDAGSHPGPVAAGTLARQLAAANPLIGGYAATYALGGCVSWPSAPHPVRDIHPTGAPPTLVVGNTGDPNTPRVGAKHLAALFPTARQLTWNGWGHTWLLSGPEDSCMQQHISTYFLDGALPAVGTVCG
jgi:pimeloyl-ACP methyl ester carboxylesterase